MVYEMSGKINRGVKHQKNLYLDKTFLMEKKKTIVFVESDKTRFSLGVNIYI